MKDPNAGPLRPGRDAGQFPNSMRRPKQPRAVGKSRADICRTLMGDPELMHDREPTEGLAPLIVKQVGELIIEIPAPRRRPPLAEQKPRSRSRSRPGFM